MKYLFVILFCISFIWAAPISFFGVPVDSTSYIEHSIYRPALYRNKDTNQDTVVVERIETRVFATPKTVSIGVFISKRLNILIVRDYVIVTTEQEYNEVLNTCQRLGGEQAMCMAIVKDLPANVSELSRINTKALQMFLVTTKCVNCIIVPME